MKIFAFPARMTFAFFIAICMVASYPGTAAAAPTAEFTYGPVAPAVGQPVSFTFTGSCDAPPCRVTWRWFKAGGSSLGNAMGEGLALTYAFPDTGLFSVVAKITNSLQTTGTATATHALAVHKTYEDNNRQIGYNTWRGVTAPFASGGGYRFAAGQTATAALSFSGTAVRYVAITGPDRGIAAMTIDGATAGSVDLYSATRTTRVLSASGLGATTHRVVIKATGTKNPASTGTAISLDEFVVGTTHYDDPSSRVTYDAWVGGDSSNTSAGTYRRSGTANATTVLTFSGTSVTWLTAIGPDQGRAVISIDGRSLGAVDNYSALSNWKIRRTYVGLTAGLHRVTVTVLGTRNPSSTGTSIISDAFTAQ